jgi:hypothetical protein
MDGGVGPRTGASERIVLAHCEGTRQVVSPLRNLRLVWGLLVKLFFVGFVSGWQQDPLTT